MSDSKRVIAYLGGPGSFSELAARAFVKADETLLACDTLHDVVSAVRDGRALHGVLPTANSSIGELSSFLPKLDGFAAVDFVDIPVRLCLLGPRGMEWDDVRAVVSHPAALAQCSQFLLAHPHLRTFASPSTRLAAERAFESEPYVDGLAAIASAHAAQLLGATIVASDIHDRRENRTRFAKIERAHANVGSRASRFPSSDDAPEAT